MTADPDLVAREQARRDAVAHEQTRLDAVRARLPVLRALEAEVAEDELARATASVRHPLANTAARV